MHKTGQSGGFLGRLLGPLLKPELPLMINVLTPLAKSALIPLGLTAPASALATDAAVHKNMFGSGRYPSDLALYPSDLDSRNTILIISNEEINNIRKIIKSIEDK